MKNMAKYNEQEGTKMYGEALLYQKLAIAETDSVRHQELKQKVLELMNELERNCDKEFLEKLAVEGCSD